MFVVTKKQIRPNTSVEFFSAAIFPEFETEFKRHMFTNYMSTGKFIDVDQSLSVDGLTKTVVTTWLSEADLNTWKADPICADFVEKYNQYCISNGIAVVNETKQSA